MNGSKVIIAPPSTARLLAPTETAISVPATTALTGTDSTPAVCAMASRISEGSEPIASAAPLIIACGV